MKYIFIFLFVFCFGNCFAQPLATDKEAIERIKENVNFLADDKLEGRRTGTAGEKLAANYISKKFTEIGLLPYGDNQTFLQAFEVKEGKEVNAKSFLKVGNTNLLLHKEYFPMPYGASGKFAVSLVEIARLDVKALIVENNNNPHFDLQSDIQLKIKEAADLGKKLFILYNEDSWRFEAKDKNKSSPIHVIFATEIGYKKIAAAQKIEGEIFLQEKNSIGNNVIGYLDNGAANTIILGAHYDHLGYGEDHNSLYTGTAPMIHNGADDNASGTAALIELAHWLKTSGLKNNNYLFLAFSGEELGLYGSKYFTQNPAVNLKTVNYMINMDMVGRLNADEKGLTVGGFGTSPFWTTIVNTNDKYFKIKVDSSGSGPSDHTSFYRKDMPVLFFFTGTHMDYHKPSDDADKINYKGIAEIINYIKNILAKTNEQPKLAFTKTREVSMGTSSFKVSLGIMPDYTFSGAGVKVDGVISGRTAEKAGIKTGDVILQLGDHPFTDVQTYMGALNKFNKGETAQVIYKRGEEIIKSTVTF